MTAERYVYSAGWQGHGLLVYVRRRWLHPTKGWRSERDSIEKFDNRDDALAFIQKVEAE